MAKKALLLEKSMMGASTPVVPAARPPATRQHRDPKDYGEPLNFRVPPEFGEQFRMVALRRKLKLNQLLQKCFEVYLREEGEGVR
jgi:hypothetical protein